MLKVEALMLTLYFNRCFSATSYLIDSLKAKWSGEELKIIISHGNYDPYLMKVSDEFLIEPELDEDAYTEFILNNCERFNVDIFFPRKHVTLLAKHSQRFNELNVKVAFVGDVDTYELFDHKLRAPMSLKEQGLALIPECVLVSDYESFTEAYRKIRSTPLSSAKQGSETVCLKPNIGIGGKGFMRISHYRSEGEDLFRESLHSISYERLNRGLAELKSFPELLLSTYLSGEEVSVDCIGFQGELLAAYPRSYLNKYEQRFDELPELISACRSICSAYNLSYLFNLQFRRHHGEWYFIELNTRSAAGAHRICALEICPLSIALKLSLGLEVTDSFKIEWGSTIRRVERYEQV